MTGRAVSREELNFLTLGLTAYYAMTKRKQSKPKTKTAAKSQAEQPQAGGRLGAEQWLAVRLKTGAGPMEPKPRRGTRAERERAALDLENGAREGKEL